jgi:hypothetical protein
MNQTKSGGICLHNRTLKKDDRGHPHKILDFTYVHIMYQIDGAMNATVYFGEVYWEIMGAGAVGGVSNTTSYGNPPNLELLIPFASTHLFCNFQHLSNEVD